MTFKILEMQVKMNLKDSVLGWGLPLIFYCFFITSLLVYNFNSFSWFKLIHVLVSLDFNHQMSYVCSTEKLVLTSY